MFLWPRFSFLCWCVRDKGPCAPFAGLRDQLRALAARAAGRG